MALEFLWALEHAQRGEVIRLQVLSGCPSRVQTIPQASSLMKPYSGWVNSMSLPWAQSTKTSPMTWRLTHLPDLLLLSLSCVFLVSAVLGAQCEQQHRCKHSQT